MRVTPDAPVFAQVRRAGRCRELLFVVGSLLLSATALLSATPATADQPATAFDLPALPLSVALESYSTTTGVVVLYNGNLTVGRLSAVVKGTMTPDVALRRLLSDTGLTAQYTAHDAFVIVPVPAEAATATKPFAIAQAALSSRDAWERQYYSLVQATLGDKLCSTSRTRPGSYRLALQFWIGSTGAVTRAKLLSSTGDFERDAAIVSMVTRMTMVEPPPNMAQPFTIVVLPRSSGGTVDCLTPDEGMRRNG